MNGAFAAFVRLSRPTFLLGGLAGGAFGTAMAADVTGRCDARAYAVAQAAVTAFHLMTHYGNDYFDRHGDRRDRRTPYSGGSGVLVDGSLPARVALGAALVCAALGLGACATLAAGVRAPQAAACGLAIAALAWAYSAPPLRLLARGWGELATALVVATLVPLCTYAAQHAPLDLRAVASTLPGAAAMFAMMLGVEFPDLAADATAGKRNLVVRLGPRRAGALGVLATGTAYVAVGAAVAAGAPPALAILEATTLPLGIGFARAIRAWRRPDPYDDEALAARGTAFFAAVICDALLAFAAAPHADATASETIRGANVVVGRVTETATLAERVNRALDDVRPGIVRDGGDVWLIRIADRTAYVQMVGACGGCPMSNATLKGAIERVVTAACPEIERVEQI